MPTDLSSDSDSTDAERDAYLEGKVVAKDDRSSSVDSPPFDQVSFQAEEKEEDIDQENGSAIKESQEQDDGPSLSGLKRALIIAPVTVVYFLVMLDTAIVSTAIPRITDEFDSLLDVGWYGSAFQLASSAFVPLAGKIYTYFPTKVRSGRRTRKTRRL